jgi:hypothetical protein
MPKRSNERQLSKDDYEASLDGEAQDDSSDVDDSNQPQGVGAIGFTRASEDVLKNRKIRTVKRR